MDDGFLRRWGLLLFSVIGTLFVLRFTFPWVVKQALSLVPEPGVGVFGLVDARVPFWKLWMTLLFVIWYLVLGALPSLVVLTQFRNKKLAVMTLLLLPVILFIVVNVPFFGKLFWQV